MFRKSLVLLLVGIYAWALISDVSSAIIKTRIPNEKKQISNIVNLLGSVGDKDFYTGTEEINWYDGKYLCEVNGLEMASIDNSEEELFLKNNLWTHPDTNFSHLFTSGRSRMVWDTSNTIIGDTISEIELPVEECLTIRGGSEYATLFDTHYCTDIWPPICQNVVADQK